MSRNIVRQNQWFHAVIKQAAATLETTPDVVAAEVNAWGLHGELYQSFAAGVAAEKAADDLAIALRGES